MPEPLTERTVIIGNSVSGKSTLAEAIPLPKTPRRQRVLG
jgi:predicted ATPase